MQNRTFRKLLSKTWVLAPAVRMNTARCWNEQRAVFVWTAPAEFQRVPDYLLDRYRLSPTFFGTSSQRLGMNQNDSRRVSTFRPGAKYLSALGKIPFSPAQNRRTVWSRKPQNRVPGLFGYTRALGFAALYLQVKVPWFTRVQWTSLPANIKRHGVVSYCFFS